MGRPRAVTGRKPPSKLQGAAVRASGGEGEEPLVALENTLEGGALDRLAVAQLGPGGFADGVAVEQVLAGDGGQPGAQALNDVSGYGEGFGHGLSNSPEAHWLQGLRVLGQGAMTVLLSWVISGAPVGVRTRTR